MLRVKVELVPRGIESRAEVIEEILIENDDTLPAGGPDEGGRGNYNIFHDESIGHLHVVDYPHMYACGFIKEVERTPEHRLLLAETAISVVRQAKAEEWWDQGKGYKRPERFPESEGEPTIPPDYLNMP